MRRSYVLKSLTRHKLIKASSDVRVFLSSYPQELRDKLEQELSEIVVLSGENIPQEMLERLLLKKIEDLRFDVNPSNLESIYIAIANEVTKEIKKTVPSRLLKAEIGFSFDTIDVDSVAAMRKSFYWMGLDYGERIQEELKKEIERVYNGELDRADVPAALKTKFGSIIDRDERYFKGVADHIILQSQNVAKVTQSMKYGPDAFRVRAIIDDKTSSICRSMHNRIIPAKHLSTQASNILAASTPNEKKQAAMWQTKPFYGTKLPDNFGLPPYHFRCRTEIEPVWYDDIDMQDEFSRVVNKPSKSISSKIASKVDHLKNTRYNSVEAMILATISAISKEGRHINDPSKKVIWGQNGCIAFIDQHGDVESCFKPKRGLKYFEDTAFTFYDSINEKSRVAKWLEKLVSNF